MSVNNDDIENLSDDDNEDIEDIDNDDFTDDGDDDFEQNNSQKGDEDEGDNIIIGEVVEDDDENGIINNDTDDDDDDDIYEDDDENDDNVGGYKKSSGNKFNGGSKENGDDGDDDDVDNDMANELEEPDEFYLQKFNSEMSKNYILEYHPECNMNNYNEIIHLTKLIRDDKNNIIDDLHKTIPYLTKYEKAKILGQRAKQINSSATPFVKVPDGIIDGYIIAEMELNQKRIPFIIRRPIPGNKCEYWNLKDLELIHF